MQVEPEGVAYVQRSDRTARLYDTRTAAEFTSGTLRGAINLPKEAVDKAKDDGRLPMEDHNTRIVVFGSTSAEARATAEAIARNAFHNVMFCVDPYCRQEMIGG